MENQFMIFDFNMQYWFFELAHDSDIWVGTVWSGYNPCKNEKTAVIS